MVGFVGLLRRLLLLCFADEVEPKTDRPPADAVNALSTFGAGLAAALGWLRESLLPAEVGVGQQCELAAPEQTSTLLL